MRKILGLLSTVLLVATGCQTTGIKDVGNENGTFVCGHGWVEIIDDDFNEDRPTGLARTWQIDENDCNDNSIPFTPVFKLATAVQVFASDGPPVLCDQDEVQGTVGELWLALHIPAGASPCNTALCVKATTGHGAVLTSIREFYDTPKDCII